MYFALFPPSCQPARPFITCQPNQKHTNHRGCITLLLFQDISEPSFNYLVCIPDPFPWPWLWKIPLRRIITAALIKRAEVKCTHWSDYRWVDDINSHSPQEASIALYSSRHSISSLLPTHGAFKETIKALQVQELLSVFWAMTVLSSRQGWLSAEYRFLSFSLFGGCSSLLEYTSTWVADDHVQTTRAQGPMLNVQITEKRQNKKRPTIILCSFRLWKFGRNHLGSWENYPKMEAELAEVRILPTTRNRYTMMMMIPGKEVASWSYCVPKR